MFGHARSPVRLDQSVTSVLGRMAALAGLSVAIAVTTIVLRTSLFHQTSTLLSATEALQLSHSGMLDQETGLRGYLAGRESLFLQPYNAGQVELASGNTRLEQALGGDATVAALVVNLRLAQQAWITQWANQAAQAPPPADLPGFLQQGKTLFDSYRANETVLNGELLQDIQQLEDQANAIANGALLVEAGVFVGGAVLWRRSRRRVRSAVVGPVSQILAALERLESGDFSAMQGVDGGPIELRSIGARLTTLGEGLESSRAGERLRTREAAEHAERLSLIVDMGREISGSLNLGYVLRAVSTSVLGLGFCSRCVIWLTDDVEGTLVARYDSAGVKGRVTGLDPVKLGEQVVGKAARFGRIIGPDAASHPDVDGPWRFAIALPMIVGARVIGVIEAGSDAPAALPTTLVEVIDTLASQAGTAIEAARLYERAEHLGRTDALTQLPNRLELNVTLAAEMARAARYRRPLSIAMLDLDHFKAVNDSLGHSRGDEILQQSATVMMQAVRDTDTIYRYGGEEFLLVMPETGGSAALTLCDRLRLAVAEKVALPSGGGRGLTVSIGVASFPGDGADVERLIKAADGALYAAKRQGRNRVLAAAADLPHIGLVAAPPGA